MANTKSAKERIRNSLRKALRNRAGRAAVKTRVLRVRRAAETGDLELATQQVRLAISALDRAAAKGVLHRNNAARRKSRLMHRLSLLAQGVVHEAPKKGTGKAKSRKATTRTAKTATSRTRSK